MASLMHRPGDERAAGAVPVGALSELRAELRRSYPLLNPWRLTRIARKYRMRRFPPGLLVDGSTRLGGAAERALCRVLLSSVSNRPFDPHPLMHSGFYRAANPDLAGSRVPPWLHYQVFGRDEGRSPHPFINVESLQLKVPSVPLGSLVDEYLGDPNNWVVEPSPYVDVVPFMVQGPWDRVTNPLTQIAAKHAVQPWVRWDLMYIDSAAPEDRGEELTTALLLLAPGLRRRGAATVVERWIGGNPEFSSFFSEVRVVPGLLVGRDGVFRKLANAKDGWLPDGSGRVSERMAVLRRSPSVHRGRIHLILDGYVDRADLFDAIERLERPLVISPSSRLLYRYLLDTFGDAIQVLEPGRQYRVWATAHLFLDAPERPLSSGDDWDSDGGVAIVVTESESQVILPSTEVDALVGAGARLCVISGSGFRIWESSLVGVDVVYGTPETLSLLRGVIDLTAKVTRTLDPGS